MSLSPKEEIELLRLLELEVREIEERNEIFTAYRNFKGRYAVLIGGSGSGKSYEIADKQIDRIVREDGHRILCVRAEQKQITESQFPLIVSRIKARYPQEFAVGKFTINKSRGNEKITYKNGNQLIFWGLDDPDKLRSIFDITSIWIEEADQTTEEALRELDRRLRGYKGQNKNGTAKYMQISLSFNPVSILSWLKKRFFDEKAKGQVMLHGERGFTDCVYWRDYVGSLDTDVLIIHTSYLDNKFIDDKYEQILNKLKQQDEDEYNIFALGMWGVAGGTFFSKKSVNQRIQDNPKPIKIGYFEFDYEHEKIIDSSIRWTDDREGYIKIYEEPKAGYPYVAGGDTAGEGSDYNIGYLTNNVTKEDAAVLRYQYDEDLYARQMYCLGKWYGQINNCNGDALLGIETKFSTHPVKELMRLGYNEQYYREERPDSITGRPKKIYGFDTNSATRPTALGMLKAEVREYPERIKSLDLLLEMTTFVKNEKGRPEAAQGAHDDCVMARAINCYVAHQKTIEIILPDQPDPDEDEDDSRGEDGFYD
jgi:phage terminase large subunit